ncbi:MAG TPA: PilZ domain-containing protein [Pyrinomonadaceae bacterium]|jgi:hypothetical protein
MGIERRRAERVRVNLDVIFDDQSRQQKGTISDISTTGCFILSPGEATPRQHINVIIQLPGDRTLNLAGHVVYNTPEIGFAIEFADLPAHVLRFIEKLVERFRQPPREPLPPPAEETMKTEL